MKAYKAIEYKSLNPENHKTCQIRMFFLDHDRCYAWGIWEVVDETAQRAIRVCVRSNSRLYESESEALQDAEREAEEYLEAMAIAHPGQIKEWLDSSPDVISPFNFLCGEYVMLKRSVLEAMPGEWQHDFLNLLKQCQGEPE